MSLETLYNAALPNTYVGTVRTRQAALATSQPLVNYLDGQSRGIGAKADEFQAEFTRNEPGAYKSGGAQGVLRNPTSMLTRWSNKSFKLAFDQEGPPSLINGYYIERFRRDSKNNPIHFYTPNVGSRFYDVSSTAKARIDASPSGAPSF